MSVMVAAPSSWPLRIRLREDLQRDRALVRRERERVARGVEHQLAAAVGVARRGQAAAEVEGARSSPPRSRRLRGRAPGAGPAGFLRRAIARWSCCAP